MQNCAGAICPAQNGTWIKRQTLSADTQFFCKAMHILLSVLELMCLWVDFMVCGWAIFFWGSNVYPSK